MRPPLTLAMLPLLAVTLVACGETDQSSGATEPTAPGAGSSPTSSPPGGRPLSGREFVSSRVRGHQLVDGTQVRLSFDGDQLGASGGCNHLGSTFTLDGDVLIADAVAMTEMACEPEAVMEQDDWLAALLTSRPTIALDGATLTVTGGQTTITLVDREMAEPDRDLEGTTWVLDGVIDGDAVSSVPRGLRVPTLDFVDGELAVDTGCNTGGGRYEAADGTMTIGPIPLTRMACAEPAGNELERVVVATLEASPSFVIEADVLTITTDGGGLVYRAMDAGPPAD